MWCVIREWTQRHAALAVGIAVLALGAPMAFAQADLEISDVTISGNPVPGGSLTVDVTVTNNGPAPDPEPNMSAYFSPDIGYINLDTSTCYEDDPDPGRTVQMTCPDWVVSTTQDGVDPFIVVDTVDDLTLWADAWSFQVNFDPLVPGGSVTASATIPLLATSWTGAYPLPANEIWYDADGEYFSTRASGRVSIAPSDDYPDGEVPIIPGSFGAPWDGSWTITANAEIVNAADGWGSLGCADLIDFTPGNIALVDRGECQFGDKANNAEIAGAAAVLIMNNVDEELLVGIAPGLVGDGVTIPTAFTTLNDGINLKDLLTQGPLELTFRTEVFDGDWTYSVNPGTFLETNDPDLENNELRTFITIEVGNENPPVADFTYAPAEPRVGDTVTFTDMSSNTPTSWAWDFGDGATSTDQNPTHAYAADGDYTVTLVATNDYGSSDPAATKTVTVGPMITEVVASFTYAPMNPQSNMDVTFTDTSTGNITTWAWDFGDGATDTVQNPVHAFADEGDYTVSLTVSDGTDSDTATAVVTVQDEPTLDQAYVIPAAALAPGVGSFWVTDVDVNNAGADMMTYNFTYVPNSGDLVTSDNFTLGAGMSVRYANVLSEVFGLTEGNGALVLMADSMYAKIMSRTFNQTDAGTYGQSIPGYHVSMLNADFDPVRILFMTENTDFRSNLGIMNATAAENFVGYELFGADGTSLGTGGVTLGPWGKTQVNQVFADYAPVEAAYVNVWSETTGGYFTCYGSVLDNATSDPTTVLPQ
jgi:PKD repeat protein